MQTQAIYSRPARKVGQITLTADQVEKVARNWAEDSARLGVKIDVNMVGQMARAFAMDDAQGLTTTATITTPVQFLQTFLPGFVEVITAARRIDDLVGLMGAGSWEDEEVVQMILEYTGVPAPYGDLTNIPLASWNSNFERRSIVRFEEGLRVGALEEARAARIRVNTAAEKRAAAAQALEIQRNKVGFLGFNSGNNRTYGFLNDPGLPAYGTLPNGAGGASTFASKTFNEIVADLIGAAKLLRTQSKDRVDPSKAPITLAIATSVVDALNTVNTLGTMSVKQWINQTYPNWRVESAPELDGANGGANVFYLYAENVADSGTDGGATFVQVVPAKFFALGVEKGAKTYTEDYSNATAGVFCKRPFAVVRRSGC